MATLFIPVGIPGCGKSHLAHGLHPYAIVSTDAIRAQLGDVNDQSRNDQVFAQFHCNIHNFLAMGKSVFADATNLDARARGNLRDIADQITTKAMSGQLTDWWPVTTHLILFRNVDQAIKRNRTRDRTVPEDVMYRMLEKYERALAEIWSEPYDYVTEVSATR